jgi:hypothetical protein
VALWSRFFYFCIIFGENHEKPHIELILKTFDLGMLEIRSDMQTALAAGDTSRPQFIRVLEYN